jgi:hypothetical protein
MLSISTTVFAQAQASIAGVVKDASGGVIPGVAVEASSPALIEKLRSVVTDSNGQYKVVDLRPGSYVVTFSLTGFTSVRREGIELTGSSTATVNAELKVGAIEQSITVSGAAPTVDVQSVRSQAVITHAVIDSIPTGRTPNTAAVLIPGVTATGGAVGVSQDVGGALGDVMVQLVAHGGRPGDSRLTLEGLATHNDANGAFTSFQPNLSATQEFTIDIGGASADTATGGVRINLTPKDGGNTFKGTFFAGGETSSMQGSNFTSELQAAGLKSVNSISYGYDVAPGFGGPLKRDSLWFFIAARRDAQHNYVGGIFADMNAGNPNAWTYAPDLSRPTIAPQDFSGENARLTWQATPRNKLSAFYDNQYRCQCPRVTATNTAEAGSLLRVPLQRTTTAAWTSPVTNRVMLEAALGERAERWGIGPLPGGPVPPSHFLVGITEQSTALQYRNHISANNTQLYAFWNGRASLSYVTGSHAFKVGFSTEIAQDDVLAYTFNFGTVNNPANVGYRFNNGTPNLITEFARPFGHVTNTTDSAVYAQDKWTVRRLTANLGLRFDRFTTSFPAQSLGPSLYTPNRNLSFPASDWTNWKDITPRLGIAYDLFGDSKTAVKSTLNKYLVQQTNVGPFGVGANPVNLLANVITRSWNDANRDFFPQCDLTSPLANGECGAMSDANFGNATKTTAYDPGVVSGWGVRPYNWEFSASIQHEFKNQLTLNVAYFRRWYGNSVITKNQAVTAADYTPYTVTAPSNSALPNGGGYTVTGFDLNPNKVGQVNNIVTFADNFGGIIEHWDGVDVIASSKLYHGLLLQGGLSTGRTDTNTCGLAKQLPNQLLGTGGVTAPTSIWLPIEYCDQNTGFVTQVKGFASYTVPKLDFQVSASLQSLPGPPIAANFIAANALVAPSLGRNLSGNAANTTINLVAPGALYGQRLNQVDLRFSKAISYKQTRLTLNLDVYNVSNSSAVLTQSDSYSNWQTPLNVVMARFAKASLQFDF